MALDIQVQFLRTVLESLLPWWHLRSRSKGKSRQEFQSWEWDQNIPLKGSLRHVLNFSFYDTSSHIDALRYIRNLCIRFRNAPKDLKTRRTMLNNQYVNQQHGTINLEEKYIEHMTAQVFCRFIVYLYFTMHQLHYHF